MITAVQQFTSSVVKLGGVRKLSASWSRQSVDFRVLLDHEDLEVGDEIFRLEDEHLAAIHDLYVRAHPVSADRFGERQIPAGETRYERD